MWQVGNASVTSLDNSTSDLRNLLDPGVGDKLQLALKYAPRMVDSALRGVGLVSNFLRLRSMNPALHNKPTVPLTDESMKAFVKYFSLHKSTNLQLDLEKIRIVYSRIKAGIGNKYNIVIYAGSETVHGYVEAPVYSLKTALDDYMAQRADGYGHVQWPKINTQDIHLNLNWLKKPVATADQIARLIVHEASHKWAYTDDKLYKSKSFMKDPLIGEEDRQLMAADTRFSGIVPMSDLSLSTLALMKNADSYAWAARRIWKKETGVMSFSD